jgi:3-methyladenine DNA glycosylase AlkC
MEALKEMFNRQYYMYLATEIGKIHKPFKGKEFIADVTDGFEGLSLNQRMRNTSVVLKKHLPQDYQKALEILQKVVTKTKGGYTNLVFPDFVAQYGHEHTELSLKALKYFTMFGSSEFAIREFLKRDFKHTIKIMCEWALDENPHVRRLASEGSRPRLPWSFKLDEIIKHPELTKPILEALKTDESLYVRKSVANHLNDISKENAGYMLDLVNSWDKTHPHTAWIIRHASRTLIKKGHSGSLSALNFEKNPQVKVEKLKINKAKIKLGENLQFEFDLISAKGKTQKLAVDYVIHYVKKSGELSPKVFKLREIQLEAKQHLHLTKKQLLKDFTTRKHFAGKHLLAIQVNGKVLASQAFFLQT